MKVVTFAQWAAAMTAALGLCFPQLALASPPKKQQSPITDVRLHDEGVLVGQVVVPEGTALADTPVLLQSGKRPIARGKTDPQGYFAFRGLHRGVYQLTAAEGHGVYRVWDAKTAPPAAQPGALIVAGQETVRGQNAARHIRNFLCNPLVIAGIVATAIAVPIAVHNADRDEGS